MSEIKEKKLNNYPEIVSLESTEKIINQMKKNIFKICLNDGSKGTGFFCKIPFINENVLNALITNNHVINLEMEKITISINNDKEIKVIELNNRIKYTNKEYDITIIEIKEKDNINNYLELDENIMKKGSNKLYINNTIYIIQYPGGKQLGVSYGILYKIFEDKEYNFNHLCCTEEGSSGSPIINIINNKVIGIHKAAKNNYNIGLFINYAIEDFINKNIIKVLNENFNLNIKDNDNLEKLDLSQNGKYIGILEKLRIDNLKELYLRNNKISDIKILEKVEFKNLEKLNLSNNEISDINALERVKFENLKDLDLSHNKISDIKVLEKVQFENLEGLYLSYNEISDLEVLENVKFEKLQILSLSHNKISDIKMLKKNNFKELKILYLNHNQISDINVLENIELKNLQVLFLNKNNISDINVFEKVKFENLKRLYLNENLINKDNNSSLINNLNNKYKLSFS